MRTKRKAIAIIKGDHVLIREQPPLRQMEFSEATASFGPLAMQTVLRWLVADFYVFGLRVQHWMPVFLAIFVIVIFVNALTDGNYRK